MDADDSQSGLPETTPIIEIETIIFSYCQDLAGCDPNDWDYDGMLGTCAMQVRGLLIRLRKTICRTEPAPTPTDRATSQDFMREMNGILDRYFLPHLYAWCPATYREDVGVMVEEIEAIETSLEGAPSRSQLATQYNAMHITTQAGNPTQGSAILAGQAGTTQDETPAEGSPSLAEQDGATQDETPADGSPSLAEQTANLVREDPFATVRGSEKWTFTIPMEALPTQPRLERQVRYRDLGREVDPLAPGTDQSKLDDAHQVLWVRLLANALTFEPELWAICVARHHERNFQPPPGLDVSMSWAAGQFLPAFYNVYDDFEEGFRTFLSAHGRDLVDKAYNEIERLLHDADQEMKKQAAKARLTKPPQNSVRAKPPITTLLHAIDDEKRESVLRKSLQRSLHAFPSSELGHLPKSAALLDHYRQQVHEGESMTDRFGAFCLKDLCQVFPSFDLVPMPDLNTEEQDHLRNATSTFYYPADKTPVYRKPTKTGKSVELDAEAEDEEAEDADDAEAEDEDDAPADLAGGGADAADAREGLDDQTVHYGYLKNCFAAQTRPIYYPGWQTPVDGPFVGTMSEESAPVTKELEILRARSKAEADERRKLHGQEENYLQPTHGSSRGSRRVSSYESARMASNNADSLLLGRSKILRNAEDYVRQALDSFHERAAGELSKTFAEMTKRDDLAKGQYVTALFTFSETLFYDNWYHVRKFFSALSYFLQKLSMDEVIETAERDVIMVVTCIAGAMADPSPWVLCLDHILRRLWRSFLAHKDYLASQTSDPVVASSMSEFRWRIIHNLYQETVLFVHGMGITGVVTRYPKDRTTLLELFPGGEDSPTRTMEWYRELWKAEPRCANPDCNRVLPQPDEQGVWEKVRAIISLATKDVRIGRHAARFFVSNNRYGAYPCLVEIVHRWPCVPMIVTVFLYYSHLYHAIRGQGCKTARGKRDINAW
ncbi:hypothetical protein LTR53_000440 [Teratosphaeriaceae sp. CCFEE 6253]|nr:hypothetical protein LTR53_000440 [Teratosphaeriaceae sp. CCFEE 6253]